jgi:hypothetical protein
MKKTTRSTARRGRKGTIKDLEPRANPKGGLDLANLLVSSFKAPTINKLEK